MSIGNIERDDETSLIIAAAVQVHRELGPGLLESVYSECLARELEICGMPFRREVPLHVHYRGALVPVNYRLDLVALESIVVEVKALERMLPVHSAQVLSYMRLGNYSRGLLINFNVPRLTDGVRRVVNNWVP